jgi:hypothetical protein
MNKKISILLFLLVIISTSSFIIYTNETYRIEKPPEFKKGTFWKNKNEQLTTFEGKKANYTTNTSCYIDGTTLYKGVNVYKATNIINEEHKIITFYFDKKNLKILDAFVIMNTSNDTLTIDFELLNFPLFMEKKWNTIGKYQEFPKKPIVEYKAEFEIENVIDTTFAVNDVEIKTKAFFVKAMLINDNKKSFGNYTYLASTKNFPGTCPVFLWNQFFKSLGNTKENKIVRKNTLTDYNW